MNRRPDTSWGGDDVSDMLAQVRGGRLEDRRRAAVSFDWVNGDLSRLGWIMSQKDIDLGTAIRVFLAGGPERFNHIHKRRVPEAEQARCNLLDAIHKRIVCGFYLPDPEVGLGKAYDQIMGWIALQTRDEAAGRVGRWQFKPEPFDMAALPLKASVSDARDLLDPSIFGAMPQPKKRSLFRELLAPLLG